MSWIGTLAIEGPEPEAATTADELARFDLLMRRHGRMVLATALRLVGNLADAQDVSQEVFLRLYRHRRKLEAAENLSGWLYRVTVNASRDLQRKRPPVDAADPVEAQAATGGNPEQLAESEERRRVLALSLRLLSGREREALVLRDLEGLSTLEVARVLGTSEATVRSQIAKARIKVKGFVERYCRSRR